METGFVTAVQLLHLMPDPYQLGSDDEWLKHSNEELARMLRQKNRQIVRWKCLSLLFLIALGWVVFKFSKRGPIEELWKF